MYKNYAQEDYTFYQKFLGVPTLRVNTLGTFLSTFQPILKGVRKGSIFGPVLFNIFINNIFHVIKNSKLYNYADDNTVSAADRVLPKLIANLAEDSLMLIKWFADNHMKANPDKSIAVGKRTKDESF